MGMVLDTLHLEHQTCENTVPGSTRHHDGGLLRWRYWPEPVEGLRYLYTSDQEEAKSEFKQKNNGE